MKRRIHIATLLLLASCSKGEDSKVNAPTTTESQPAVKTDAQPTAPVAPLKQITAMIASVQLGEDCPEPKDKPAAMQQPDSKRAPVRRARRRAGAGPMKQFCSQSTLQMSFLDLGESDVRTSLKELRLKSKEGKVLATLQSRMPTIWRDGQYQAWDGVLPAKGEDTKVSYKLSIPNWSELEKTIGGSSFGPMFMLEVDVEINGKVTTILSPQFVRREPQIVRT